MKNFNPKVSIIIPVYNGSKYVGEAIDSALAQTYKNIEIIVANDGSDDNGATERVARSYGDKIIYLHQEKNGGAATVLNLAIKHMTGDYFSWLSHDDLYYPNKVKRQVEELAKLQNKNTIIMSELNGINEKKEQIYQTQYLAHIKEHPSREKSNIYPVVYNKTHGCTLLIPKKCFDEVGLFDPKERVAQDFEFFYRAFSKFPSRLVAETLVTARDTSNRMGRRAKPRAIQEYSNLYIKIIDNLSEEEVLMLAPDKLSFYYDMHAFFKDAGYTIALAYIDKKIKDYIPKYAEDFIDSLINKSKGYEYLESRLLRLIQVSEIDDNELAVDSIDLMLFKTLKRAVGGVKKISQSSDVSLAIYDLANDNDLKRTSSFLLSSTVKLLLLDDDSRKRVISEKIAVGEGSSIESNVEVSIRYISKKKTKPRIMFCSSHWLTGGMERVMANLFAQLADDYEVFLLTPYDNLLGSIELPRKVKQLRITNGIFYTNFDGSILSHAMLLEIDVVVGFYNLFWGQLNFYEICRGTGIKTIASNHEYYFYPYRDSILASIVEKRLTAFGLVDAVVWPTNVSAAIYGLHGKNSFVIHNPNTFNSSSTISGSKKTEHNIIAVGRFGDYIKRVDRIFQAFALVLDKEPEAKLMLVGKYDIDAPIGVNGPSMIELMTHLRISESSVMFIGETDNVASYYKKAKLIVVASDSEGFGMVINEAASFGVPAVCNYFPGVEDLITDGKNGFITDQGDIGAMADKMCRILLDDKLRISLGKDAAKSIDKFGVKIISSKWKYLIDTLLSGGSYAKTSNLLNNELGYTPPSCKNMNHLLFGELGRIAQGSDGYINSVKLSEVYDSRSWRITKPLRLVEKTYRSLKKGGVRTTIKKIVGKVFKR